MATPKNDYWLKNVWGELPYRVPGQEGLILPSGTTAERPDGSSGLTPGHIRYNTSTNRLEAYVGAGTWEDIVSGNVPTITTAALVGNLPSGPQTSGAIAIVLDDGDQNELMFVWNNANIDLTAPYYKWRMISSTELFSDAVVYRNAVVSDTAGTVPIGAPFNTLFNPYIKEINIDIQQPFASGVGLSIQESGSGILMASGLINPQLVGTYQLKIPGSNNVVDGFNDAYLVNTTGQMQLNVINPSTSGRAVVYIKAVTQLEQNP